MAIEGASALNRVRWAQGGKEVAVGDSEGRIWIYDVGEVHIFFLCGFGCLGCACVCFWVFVFHSCVWLKDLVKLLTGPMGHESRLSALANRR